MHFLSPITRISIGLVFLTVSLMLVAELVGIAPDRRQAELQARKVIVESLAVQLASQAGQVPGRVMSDMLSAVVRQNEDLLSAAVRKPGGEFVAMAGDHERHWSTRASDRTGSTHVVIPIFDGDNAWGRIEVRFASLDGESIIERLSGTYLALILFVAGGGALAYTLFLRRALQELDPSAAVPERVRNAFDVLSEGLLILDRNGRAVHANHAFLRRMGLPLQSVVGKDGQHIDNMRWQTESEQRRLPWVSVLQDGMDADEAQVVISTAEREQRVFMAKAVAIRGARNELRGALATFDDLTEIQRKNAELERTLRQLEESRKEISRQNEKLQTLATRDPLTGCYNRRALFDQLVRAFDESAAAGGQTACIMVDIDHFKSINDRFGHATGDKIIRLVADVLGEGLRESDFVGRYGGEEFCVILVNTDAQAASRIAERMRASFERRTAGKLTDRSSITASFGVSAAGAGIETVEQLVDCADKALYLAKQSGRNRVASWRLGAASLCEFEAEAPGTIERPDGVARVTAVSGDGPPAGDEPVARLAARNRRALDGPADGQLTSQQVFIDRVRQGVERAARYERGLGVLMIGLVTARRVDSAIGHSAREKLVELVRERIVRNLRGSDTVARLGRKRPVPVLSRTGDHEMAVLLSDLDREQGATWAIRRVIHAFQRPFDVEGYEVYVDISIGVSQFPQDGSAPEQLIRYARAARAEAELEKGSATCRFYSRQLDDSARRQLQVVSDLHKALENNEFVLAYQPIVSLAEGAITALEVLVRWEHPRYGQIGPAEFIAEAEHAGLIGPIGQRVLESACGQLHAWRRVGHLGLSIAVNLSALQFRDDGLAQRVLNTVDAAEVPRECVIVEMTESAVMDNLDRAVLVTRELSDAGLGIAVDDFGTGYSSFGYLSQFPFNKLKIDRSFVTRAAAHSPDASIVGAIISVGHSLGLTVVAEGVETPEQLQLCRALGCDEIQGYLLGRPMLAPQVSELLSQPHKVREALYGDGMDDPQPGMRLPSSNDPLSSVLNRLPEVIGR